MDHGGMSSDGVACKVEMLWNWNTIDACFLASSWQIKNQGMMAATCIGVILLVILVEFFRRLGKEYDALLQRGFERQATTHSVALAAAGCTGAVVPTRQTLTYRASPLQQFIRAFIHAVTFGGAYIVMLLAMYFNGYVIICIFIGSGLGKFFCDWLVVRIDLEGLDGPEDKNKGIEEATVCCG
ncbi:Copper Transporter integral membrane protein that functions in high affinity copper transport [Fusarium irregulare]|nr:Copper Transporter integral membrane protein that functions in high affinity copper transport [Fusarium irregulare]